MKINKVYIFVAIIIITAFVIIGSIFFLNATKYDYGIERSKFPNNNNISNANGNNANSSNDNSGAESSTEIYLEQNEYKMGERIIGTLRNSESFDIMVASIAIEQLHVQKCDKSIGDIENKKCAGKSEWKTVKYNIECACGEAVGCEGVNFEVLARSTFEFNWGQEVDEIGLAPDSCKKAEAGKYRVKANYLEVPNLPPGAVSEAQIEQTMYSKEFFIIDEAAVNNSSGEYKVIGSFSFSGESSFIEKIGDFVFMTDTSEGLLAIDVSDQKNPKLISKLKIGGGGAYALSMDAIPSAAYALVGGYASTKVALVGISFENNSVKMEVIDEIDAKRSVQSIARSAHYAYLAIDGSEVEILRIEKETSFPYKAKGLASKGFLNIGESSHAIGVATPEGTAQLYTLAVAQGENGLGVYDISRSDILNLKSDFSSIGYVNSVAFHAENKNIIFAGVDGEVKIIDISKENEARILGIKEIDAGEVLILKTKDNLLYVASGEQGIKIFDVSNINSPSQIAAIDTSGRARDFVIDGGYIYVADDADGLKIISKQ